MGAGKAWLVSLWLLSGCTATLFQTRAPSAGRVLNVATGRGVAAAAVVIRTSVSDRSGCGTQVLDSHVVRTDAFGRWHAASAYGLRLFWLFPDAAPSYCQRYSLLDQPTLPPLGPLEDRATVTSQDRRLRLSVREFEGVRPRLQLIAAIAGSTDQVAWLQLGAAFELERSLLNLALRAAVEPGLWGGGLTFGVRVGTGVRVDLSARLLRVWRRGFEGIRIGPQLGLDAMAIRLAVGFTSALQGPLDGYPVEAFAALGWNVVF
jgi:hypothetical protein